MDPVGLSGHQTTDSSIDDMVVDTTSAPKMHPFFNRDHSKSLMPPDAHSIDTEGHPTEPPENSTTKPEDADKGALRKKRGRPKKAAPVPGQLSDSDFSGFANGFNGIINVDTQTIASAYPPTFSADGVTGHSVRQAHEAKKPSSRKEMDKGQQQLTFTSSNIVLAPLLSPKLTPQDSASSPKDEIQVPATSSPPRIDDEMVSMDQEHTSDQYTTQERSHYDLFNQNAAPSELLPPQSVTTKTRGRHAMSSNASEPPRKKRRSEGSYKQLTMSAIYGESPREEATSTDSTHLDEPVSKPSLIVKLKLKALPLYPRPSLIVKLKVKVPEKLPERPKKPLHPFFMKGSAKPRNLTEANPTTLASASETESDVPLSNNQVGDANQKPLVTSFGGLQLSTKPKWQVFVDPPWPAPGAVHVRGLPQEETARVENSTDLETYCVAKPKGKDRQFQFPESESILQVISSRLKHGMQANSFCSSAEISPFVRIPARVELTATPLLKEHLRTVLKARLSSSSLHAALRNLRDIMAECEALTTQFDMLKPQNVAWTNKYAPKNTAEVLQDSQDPQIISKWLQQMKVWSVGTAPLPSFSNGNKLEPRRKAKKKSRKKRRDDLEGFLVSDDEDYNTMDEITDPEDHSTSIWKVRRPPRSEGRISTTRYTDLFDGNEEYSDPAFSDRELAPISYDSPKSPPIPRFSNVIILSGPNGVGKTAAVYAAAAEQGFSVFEVHAGQRRGKQELIDLVGDMTKNHLVHQDKSLNLAEASLDREEKAQQDGPKDNSKSQRQSLILIEEADIIFEEDKLFWSQVSNLVAESKRPVVITCNNPEMVRGKEDIEESLFAELCFSIPPKDLTVDYLLMLCAVEGHLLNRITVEQLYEQCKGDLRMSIMQLDFWCRMAVGDRTGGMKWAIKRWPPGIDMEEGEILRCFSVDTYLPAMGQFGRELLPETSENVVGIPLQTEDDCWLDILENTGVDLRTRVFDDVHPLLAHSDLCTYNSSLTLFNQFIETYSDMDVFAGSGTLAWGFGDQFSHMTILDPTHPRQHERHDADDLVGVTVLDTEPLGCRISTERELAMFVGSKAYKTLKKQVNSNYKPSQKTVFTESVLASLVTSSSDELTQPDFSSQDSLKSLFEKPLLPSMKSFPPPNPGIYQFHQPFSVFIADISPFVRAIARADLEREQSRSEMGNLLSMGGSGSSNKRRNTRAAATAECGGVRGKGRRDLENYLSGNIKRMVETAGEGWAQAVEECVAKEASLCSDDDNDTVSEMSANNSIINNNLVDVQENVGVTEVDKNISKSVIDDSPVVEHLEDYIVKDEENLNHHPIITNSQNEHINGRDMEMADQL